MTKTNNQKLENSSKPAKKKSHPFWKAFWLSFLVVSLAYAWYSFYAPSNNVAWANSMEEAQKLAKESDKNMLLFFTGDWCVPCRIMKREVFADEGVSNAINSKVVPIIINIDDSKNAEIVKRYNAGITPITLFSNHKGEVIDYAVGKLDKEQFLEMLGKIDSTEL